MLEVPGDLPPPTAEGTFAKTPLVQVLVYVLERSLTGTIEIVHPEGPWAALLVIEGLPSKARTSEPVSYLGNVLRELGVIDDQTLNASLALMAKERRLHGQILLGMGKLGVEQLHEGLRAQLVRKIEHLYDWPAETRFAYYDGFDALHTYGADDPVQLDSLPLVWACVRTQPPWEHVHAALTRVGTSAMRLSPAAQIERFELNKEERAAAELLRGQPLRVHDLVATRLLGAATTQLLAYTLLITKQVELLAPAAKPEPSQLARVQLAQVAQPLRAAAIEERAPGVDPRAPVSSPFPPIPSVGHASAGGQPVPSRGADPASPPGARGSAAPFAPSAPTSDPQPQGSASAKILTPQLEQRRQDIIARAKSIKSENYFEMLGIPKDAKPEQIQQAYLALAKVWHPDRLPAPIADARDACATVFSHMTEAQQTLIDPKRRANYMDLLKDGGATPDEQEQVQAVLEAATNFQKAEFFLRRGDFKEAEVLCRKAHEGDSKQPEYLAMLAWLESMKPENQGPKPTQERIAMLDQAIMANERLERAVFYRGMLYKRLGDTHSAVRDFRRASELNPRNLDAVREVRLFEMRASRGSIPPPGAMDEKSEKAKSGSQRPPVNTRREGKATESTGTGSFLGKLFKK
jgi:curved DNA-binding protein CbpA